METHSYSEEVTELLQKIKEALAKVNYEQSQKKAGYVSAGLYCAWNPC